MRTREATKIRDYILGNYTSFQEAVNDCEYTSQAEALLLMLSGKNVFVSGPAGSGKSYTIQKYVELRSVLGLGGKVYKTSTTGISSVNIDGITIHSWSGMGAKNFKYSEALKNKDAQKAWYFSEQKIKETSVLIIDEISMLSERGLEYVVERIKQVKKSLKNIQIIVSGDFSQLPPVSSSKDANDIDCSNFCYQTKAWNECEFIDIYLDKLYRTADTKLSKLLTEISMGNGDSQMDVINTCNFTTNDFKKGSMLLLSKNIDVDSLNAQKQRENPNEGVLLKTLYGIGRKPYELALERDIKIAEERKIPKDIYLKDGDTVMVLSNQNDTYPSSQGILANGTIGVFRYDKYTDEIGVEYKGTTYWYNSTPENIIEKIEWKNKEQVVEELGRYYQFPLRLAYAMTIHKSQGQTFSDVTIDLSGCWRAGLGYVSLSRATHFDGITLIKKGEKFLSSHSLKIDSKSIEIKKDLLNNAKKLREEFDYSVLLEKYLGKGNIINDNSNVLEETEDYDEEDCDDFEDIDYDDVFIMIPKCDLDSGVFSEKTKNLIYEMFDNPESEDYEDLFEKEFEKYQNTINTLEDKIKELESLPKKKERQTESYNKGYEQGFVDSEKNNALLKLEIQNESGDRDSVKFNRELKNLNKNIMNLVDKLSSKENLDLKSEIKTLELLNLFFRKAV